MTREQAEEKIIEVIALAAKLKWVVPLTPEIEKAIFDASYPLMRLSEVEKCMLALLLEEDLHKMQKWVDEITN